MSGWFLIAVLGAEVVGTVAGFGSSTVLLPIALFFFEFKVALTVVAWVHVLGNIAKMGWFRGGGDLKLLLKFGVPSVIASLVGASLVGWVDQEWLKRLLGMFLVVYAWWEWGEKQ